ncbi:MAG: hypothetical protein ACFB21_05245 [Opitutales bacterium]
MHLARTNAILPFFPASDLRGAEGRFATVDQTDGLLYISGLTERLAGVITFGGNVGEPCSVAMSAGGLAGTVKVKLAAPVTAVGQYLQLNEDGSVSPDSGSGTRILVAQAVETGVADELIEAILFRPYTLSN